MYKYRTLAFITIFAIVLSVPTFTIAQDPVDYIAYQYHCEDIPNAVPDPWQIEWLDPEVEVTSDGMLLYLNGWDPYPSERGNAQYLRYEPSLADADYYTMGVNMYVAQSSGTGFLTDFIFGASDGQKDLAIWGRLGSEVVYIITETSSYWAEVDLTTPVTFYLVVDRSNVDPSCHIVKLYINHDTVIQVPYVELKEKTYETPGFGFGTVHSDTVWDYVQYEVGQQRVSALRKADAYIKELSDDAFKDNAEQRKIALSKKLDEAATKIETDEYQEAIDKLENDIRAKMDGNPHDDWITDPTAQGDLCTLIDNLTAYLRTL